MSNPNTNSILGMGAMTDTIDFMKNLWGGMSMPGLPGMKIPGMVMPTLSVEEIDKQIKDLKSVESWLTMNLTMLRGTIQALEVQSATITTIQSVSSSFASAMQPKPADAAKEEKPAKSAFESPFAKQAEKQAAEPAQEPAPAEPAAQAASGNSAAGGDASMIPPMANPAAWWGMLQDQFKQAVDSAAAMTPDMPAAEATKEEKAAPQPKAKAKKSAPVEAPVKRKPAPKA